jgi:N-acetylmuramoyl-L-alanine amidase
MPLTISNDRRKGAPSVTANAFGGRMHPTVIVCHDTADRPKPNDTVSWFANKRCRVSAHFVVERDGSVTQMVPCDRKAYHAGKSSFKGRSSCNNFAIGIEIDKNGRGWFHKNNEPGIEGIEYAAAKAHGGGYWLPYTQEQIATVTQLCRALVKAYPTIKDITPPWEIAPGRKSLSRLNSSVTRRMSSSISFSRRIRPPSSD